VSDCLVGQAACHGACSLKMALRMTNRLLKKAFSGMGRTLHEVFRIRKVRDHRTGGTVVALDPSNTGADRDPEIDVLVHSGQQAPKSPVKRRSRAELAMPLGGIAEILGR
jgi:hypothetical protein